IPRAAWNVVYVDSAEANFDATKAFDDDASSFWHTQFAAAQPPPPHEIQIDMGETYSVNGFQYLPRQDGKVQGRIGQYIFYVSDSTADWGDPVATGIFANTAAKKEISFPTKSGRYVRFVAVTEANGLPFTAVAELNVLRDTTP